MKSLYTITTFAVAFLLFSGCSKDFLKSYDKRVIGTWKITNIDRVGFNGSDNLPFSEGDSFTFSEDGGLTYVRANTTYQGSWDIVRRRVNDQDVKSLSVSAIDFTNQNMRTEYFNQMVFTNTNRFTGLINYTTRTYVYRFLRQ